MRSTILHILAKDEVRQGPMFMFESRERAKPMVKEKRDFGGGEGLSIFLLWRRCCAI